MQDSSVFELVLFKTKPGREERIAEIRAGVREALKTCDGFLGFRSFISVEGSHVFADLAEWSSHENALSAARAFNGADPRFQPYMREIKEVIFMGHFSPGE